ncbi:unnamed protein product [Closterium sp. NIES-54]
MLLTCSCRPVFPRPCCVHFPASRPFQLAHCAGLPLCGWVRLGATSGWHSLRRGPAGALLSLQVRPSLCSLPLPALALSLLSPSPCSLPLPALALSMLLHSLTPLLASAR